MKPPADRRTPSQRGFVELKKPEQRSPQTGSKPAELQEPNEADVEYQKFQDHFFGSNSPQTQKKLQDWQKSPYLQSVTRSH